LEGLSISSTSSEEVEAIVQSLYDLIERQDIETGGRELDRKRQSV
jgi:hypothetical protein